MTDPRPDLLTAKQAAEAIGCHRGVISNLLRDGRLDRFDVGGDQRGRHIRIPRESVDRYIAERDNNACRWPPTRADRARITRVLIDCGIVDAKISDLKAYRFLKGVDR